MGRPRLLPCLGADRSALNTQDDATPAGVGPLHSHDDVAQLLKR